MPTAPTDDLFALTRAELEGLAKRLERASARLERAGSVLAMRQLEKAQVERYQADPFARFDDQKAAGL